MSPGLAGLVQTQLLEDPFSGQLFVFRGRRGDRVKVLWWDGDGQCLAARERHPRRWSRHTRNWSPIEVVTLNPERETVAGTVANGMNKASQAA